MNKYRLQQLAGLRPDNPLLGEALIQQQLDEGAREWIKNVLLASGLTLAALRGSPSLHAQAPVSTAQVAHQKVQPGDVLTTVSVSNSVPIVNGTVNMDDVHSILSSKKVENDFVEQITKKLRELRALGYAPDVKGINIKTTVSGDKVNTSAKCDIIESSDHAYTLVVSRGSAGSNAADYIKRHDDQVSGLIEKLQAYEAYTGGHAERIGEEHIITFIVNGKKMGYKQSFYKAATKEDENAAIDTTPAPDQAPSTSSDTIQADVQDVISAYTQGERVYASDLPDEALDVIPKTLTGTISSYDFKTFIDSIDSEIGSKLKAVGGGNLTDLQLNVKAVNGKALYTATYTVTNKIIRDPESGIVLKFDSFTARANMAQSKQAAETEAIKQSNLAAGKISNSYGESTNLAPVGKVITVAVPGGYYLSVAPIQWGFVHVKIKDKYLKEHVGSPYRRRIL